MKLIVPIFLFLFLSLDLYGQKRAVQPVRIGQNVSEVTLKGFLNNSSKKIHISNMKGKLVIFDFWSVVCGPCIAAIPELNALQKRFSGRVQIILITSNSRKEVKKLLSRMKLDSAQLSMIVSDTILNKMFPHSTVPHHVWIDKNGIVKFITDGYNTNEKNIMKVLNGKAIHLRLKDEITDFNFNEPLWLEGNGRLDKHLIYYSYLMNRIDEYGGGPMVLKKDTIKNQMVLKIVNQSILTLFKIAYGGFPPGKFDFNSRILLDVSNPERFYRPRNTSKLDQWLSANTFSYEINIPLKDSSLLYKFMQRDLKKVLSYDVNVEKKEVECLSLVRIPYHPIPISHGGKPVVINKNGVLSITNKSLNSSLITALAYSFRDSLPVINESGILDNVDMEIKSGLTDIPSLRKELQHYGLDLKKGYKYLNMLVIEDQNR